jgi:hypothetical protein
MATKVQEKLKVIRRYKLEKQTTEADMREVAKYAVAMGWPLPKPQDPIDLLAKTFSEAAREEIRHDKKTKRPYRANLAITFMSGDKQTTLWIDTDEAPRHRMEKALNRDREQMVGEAVMGTNTADHWNNVNPEQIPLRFETDLTDDVSWRLNGEEEPEQAA